MDSPMPTIMSSFPFSRSFRTWVPESLLAAVTLSLHGALSLTWGVFELVWGTMGSSALGSMATYHNIAVERCARSSVGPGI